MCDYEKFKKIYDKNYLSISQNAHFITLPFFFVLRDQTFKELSPEFLFINSEVVAAAEKDTAHLSSINSRIYFNRSK